MPTILCFGDSNVWGNIPGSFDPSTGLCKRYERSKRWPGMLQSELGETHHVVEEAINGRTTSLDEIIPGRPYKNGLALLAPALEAHYPIQVVVFMLGTNDTKVQYNLNLCSKNLKPYSPGAGALFPELVNYRVSSFTAKKLD